jgi:hypothetical protein
MQIHENGVAAESHSQFDASNQNSIIQEQKNCPYFQQMYHYLKEGSYLKIQSEQKQFCMRQTHTNWYMMFYIIFFNRVLKHKRKRKM